MSRSILLFGSAGLGLGACASPAGAAVTAAEVVNYQPGSATSFTNPSAALGLPAGDTGFDFGALTPFNPPFKNDQIVIVGAGGSLTLRLSSPVSTAGAGPEIGVFANNGIWDVSPGGTGTAGNPAVTFTTALPTAFVSVSADGQTFVPLGGAAVVFDNPTNFYTDTSIANYSAPLGTVAADFSKPFAGTLSSFDGLTYPQMLQVLGGSGGGTWLDVSGTGLASVGYVRFDVTGEGQRLVLDAVTAVPEPAVGLVVAPMLALLSRRRRSVR